MANIKLNLDYPIYDGIGITFKAPCDCTGASGLKICHLGGEQVFTFRDSHNNNLADVGNVFVKGAFVKVVLDIAGSNAYIQNADNNAYLHKTIRWGECDGSIEIGETAKAVTSDSVAVGTNNVAGCRGFYISAIDTTNKYIYLTKTKTADPVITSGNAYYDTTFETPTYDAGDEFSIINGKHYAFCGAVVSADHNKIAYADALPFSGIVSSNDKNHIFFVPTKAHIGSIEDVFFGTVVLGRDNIGAGANGFVAGYKNILGGDYGLITGHNNKGGHACDITGENNTDKGNNNHIEGAQNEATGDFVHVEGQGNIGAGDAQHVEGKYNAPDETSARIVGGGSSDADRRNIETLDWLGNLWVRGKVYVGGNDISESVALALASDLGLKITTGSYTGNSTSNMTVSKTLTFDIKPALVIVKQDDRNQYNQDNSGTEMSPLILIRPSTKGNFGNSSITWGDNSVKWSGYGANNQYNYSACSYTYVALGYADGAPEDIVAQSKTVTPSTEQQTVLPDSGYNSLASVIVEPIPYSESDNTAGGTTVTIG